MRRGRLLAIAITLLVAVAAIAVYESYRPSPTTPTVGAFLYLWYGYNYTSHVWSGGPRTSHWNDSASGTVVDRPAIGYYASLNNNTLRFQLSSMRYAGISVIVVSWWGTGNATQSRSSSVIDSAVNNATLNLFRYLEANKGLWSFKVAIMVEPFNQTYDMTPHDYAKTYGYLDDHYYHPYSDLVYNLEGKPLVLSFNAPWPGYGGGFRAGRLPSNSTFTYRLVGGTPNPVDWNFWTGMSFLDSSGGRAEPQNYEHAPVVSSDGEVGIAPRYDDYYFRQNYMRFDYRMSEGMYITEWTYALAQKNVNLILLYSWNEYHERTAIEPHWDATAQVSSTYLLNITAGYTAKLG